MKTKVILAALISLITCTTSFATPTITNYAIMEGKESVKEQHSLRLGRANNPFLTQYPSEWYSIERSQAISKRTGDVVRCAIVRFRRTNKVVNTVLFKPFQASVLECWKG